jgi:hypothetical protein
MIEMNQNQLLTAEKLKVTSIQFSREEVLTTIIEKKERLIKLVSAMKLGNNHKQKVRIYFMNASNELMEIKAKVWSVTEKYVILKNSITIPITSIRDVNFI